MSDLSPIKRIFIVFLQLLAGGFVTDAIIDRFRSLLVLIPGDRWGVGLVTPINQGLAPTAGVRAAAWGISCGGKSFHAPSPISAALEHSDRLQQRRSSLLHPVPTCTFTLRIHTRKPEFRPAPFHLWLACRMKTGCVILFLLLHPSCKRAPPIEIKDWSGTEGHFSLRNIYLASLSHHHQFIWPLWCNENSFRKVSWVELSLLFGILVLNVSLCPQVWCIQCLVHFNAWCIQVHCRSYFTVWCIQGQCYSYF